MSEAFLVLHKMVGKRLCLKQFIENLFACVAEG